MKSGSAGNPHFLQELAFKCRIRVSAAFISVSRS
jgi:hypothetical protein